MDDLGTGNKSFLHKESSMRLARFPISVRICPVSWFSSIIGNTRIGVEGFVRVDELAILELATHILTQLKKIEVRQVSDLRRNLPCQLVIDCHWQYKDWCGR